MAGITNDKLLEVLNEMKADISTIKGVVPIVEKLNNDAYIGNGFPPWKQSCRDYEEEKRGRETAKTEAIKDRKDDNKWFKRSVIGVVIVQTLGMVFAFFK